jgi:hypothetical protein
MDVATWRESKVVIDERAVGGEEEFQNCASERRSSLSQVDGGDGTPLNNDNGN